MGGWVGKQRARARILCYLSVSVRALGRSVARWCTFGGVEEAPAVDGLLVNLTAVISGTRMRVIVPAASSKSGNEPVAS